MSNIQPRDNYSVGNIAGGFYLGGQEPLGQDHLPRHIDDFTNKYTFARADEKDYIWPGDWLGITVDDELVGAMVSCGGDAEMGNSIAVDDENNLMFVAAGEFMQAICKANIKPTNASLCVVTRIIPKPDSAMSEAPITA